MNFEQAPEFQKDMKRLGKKWRSLPQDIIDAQMGLLPLYIPQEGVDITIYRNSFFGTNRATILHQGERHEVVKMRLDVADLGRNDKVRIVFIAVISENCVLFIEMYAKNEKSREDQSRIKRYL